MRFQSRIRLKGSSPVVIPSTYRRNILALIKEGLKQDDATNNVFEEYYGDRSKNRQKPFTFSVNIPVQRSEPTDQKGSLILGGDWLNLSLSACDSVFLIYLYNGLVRLKKSNYPLFPGYTAEINEFHLVKEKKIDADDMVFKTYSPFLVRDLRDKKGGGYIAFDHERFPANLFYSIENLCRNFIAENYKLKPDQVRFEQVKCKAIPVPLYGGEIGNSGIFKIKAPCEVLQLIYDAGLGAKRSQGFGMLEVVG